VRSRRREHSAQTYSERTAVVLATAVMAISKQHIEIGFFLTLYLMLKIGLNYYNNWLLSSPPVGLGFPSPLFYTMCHMVASTAGASIIMGLRPTTGQIGLKQFDRSKWKLLSLSFLFCISIGSNNMSLAHIGLSVNQVLKATCAIFVLFFSWALEGKTYSKQRIGLIVLIVIGTCISVPWGTPNAEVVGIILVLASVVAVAAKTSLGSVLMKGAKTEGLTPMALVFYESLFSIVYLFVALMILGEGEKLVEFANDGDAVHETILVLMGGSLMAFTYNFASFKFLSLTSSVTHTICGNITLVAVVVVPAIFIDHITGVVSWVGFFIFLSASALYTYVGHREAQMAKAKAAAATQPADGKAEGGKGPTEQTPLTQQQTSK